MYINGIDATISLGYTKAQEDQDELDIITIDFNESQNKLPVYGYKSFEWDSVLYGEIVVQGMFMLNKESAISLRNYISSLEETELGNLAVSHESALKGLQFTINIHYKTKDESLLQGGHYYTNDFRIEDVAVTGFQQSLAANGNPVGEIYNFVGKRVHAYEGTFS